MLIEKKIIFFLIFDTPVLFFIIHVYTIYLFVYIEGNYSFLCRWAQDIKSELRGKEKCILYIMIYIYARGKPPSESKWSARVKRVHVARRGEMSPGVARRPRCATYVTLLYSFIIFRYADEERDTRERLDKKKSKIYRFKFTAREQCDMFRECVCVLCVLQSLKLLFFFFYSNVTNIWPFVGVMTLWRANRCERLKIKILVSIKRLFEEYYIEIMN